MRDDRLDLPGRDVLEIRSGDRVHQGLLDPGIALQDPRLKRSLPEPRSGQDAIAVRGDGCPVASAIPKRSPGRCPLVTVSAGLLERFEPHPRVGNQVMTDPIPPD